MKQWNNLKKVKTEYGNIEVQTPRDRNATFNPIIIEKGQTRLTGFEEKCIALYAKGVSLRDIEKTLKEIYKRERFFWVILPLKKGCAFIL